MAASVATPQSMPLNSGARLRVEQNNARRERQPNRGKNFFDLTALQTAAGTNTPTATVPVNERYQRAFRQRQIVHQIGQAAGLTLDRQQQNNDQPDEFQALSNNYAEQEAMALLQSQLNLDARASQVKNRALKDLKERGLKEGLETLVKAGTKEIGAVTVSAVAAAGEVVDSAFEDLGLVEGATFVQNQIQAVRTIFSPPPPPPEAATDLKSLGDNVRRWSQDMVFDTLFPRFNLHTVSGLTSLGKAIYQWFLLSLIFIAICAYIAFSFAVLYFMYYIISWVPGI